ncbi:hypothetical protein [Halonotius sp. GCM10025705]|uniref:hypothetical protein n=1 Tax=Halonotius sp. GCM10025705 TaxID=3252678 RepID=UPI00362280D2
MIVFDTTFLLDYLDAVPATEEFLQRHESKPFFTPSLSLFEVYRGLHELVAPRPSIA